MLRKVTSVRFLEYFDTGFGSNCFMLECGHEQWAKASAGSPAKKRCNDCANLKAGGVINHGSIRETWDAEKQWPKREAVAA